MSESKVNLDTLELCKIGGISAVLQQRPYVLVFKTTNWCWNKCEHCCECSGPDQPKTFIPKDVIIGYIDQATQDQKFSNHVILTGGELMAAYKFVDEHYVPDIMDHVLNKKLFLNVNTNAGWAGTPVGEEIFTDIKNIMLRHRLKVITQKNANTNYTFQIQLSLDRFHKNSLERDFKVIEQLSRKKITGAALAIRISSFDFDNALFEELLKKLHNAGITTKEALLYDSKTQEVKSDSWYLVNDNLALEYSNDALLFDGGRAKNIANAHHDDAPQFVFLSSDYEVLVAFDSFGNVTLGENNGEKITVPWRDKNGTARPLADIYTDLVRETKQAEAEYIAMAEQYANVEKTKRGFWGDGLFGRIFRR